MPSILPAGSQLSVRNGGPVMPPVPAVSVPSARLSRREGSVARPAARLARARHTWDGQPSDTSSQQRTGGTRGETAGRQAIHSPARYPVLHALPSLPSPPAASRRTGVATADSDSPWRAVTANAGLRRSLDELAVLLSGPGERRRTAAVLWAAGAVPVPAADERLCCCWAAAE